MVQKNKGNLFYVRPSSVTSGQHELASHDFYELAARLGSIVTFDRRGDVVYLDDFEDNINKWEQDYTGVGRDISLSSGAARNGGKSAKLTTGNIADDYASIRKYCPRPITTRIGFEASFSSHHDAKHIEFRLSVVSDGIVYIASIRYDPQNKELQYLDSLDLDTWHTFATGIVLGASTYLFNTMKLTMDYQTLKYMRAVINETEYNLSGHNIYSGPTPWSDSLLVKLTVTTNVASNISIYVDDVIVTQNEP